MLNPISIGLIAAILIASAVGFPILFKKAGLPWWKAFVPVYNDYVWMRATWTVAAFVRRLVALVALACGAYALYDMGAVTVDAEELSFTVLTPFTLNQSLVGLVVCVAIVWLAIMQLEANWYAADAFDGTLGTFLGLSFCGGFAYLWMAYMVRKGERDYLGDLDTRIEAEEAAYEGYAS